MDELLKRISDVLAHGKHQVAYNHELNYEFAELYFLVFKEKICTTCPGAIQEKYNRLKNYLLNPTQMDTLKTHFKLKNDSGVIDTSFGSIEGVPMHVTKHNLTDKIAEKMISVNPSYIKQFKYIANTGLEVLPTPNEVAESDLPVEEKDETKDDKKKDVAPPAKEKPKK